MNIKIHSGAYSNRFKMKPQGTAKRTPLLGESDGITRKGEHYQNVSGGQLGLNVRWHNYK